MSLKANEKFTWTHPEHGEIYTFVATEVVEFGNIYTITLADGRVFDAFSQEINCPESYDFLPEQINPEPDDGPIRYGALR